MPFTAAMGEPRLMHTIPERIALLILILVTCTGCVERAAPPPSNATLDTTMKPLAEQYVKLVLAVGEHDANYVDAYYGPPQWRDQVKAEKAPLDSLQARATRLMQQVDAVDVIAAEELVRLRKSYLSRQLSAVNAYVSMLKGNRLKFDEESTALYDVQAPTFPESHFQSLLDSLNAVVPGSGPMPARIEQYKRAFVIPKEKLDTVFRAAIAEARKRTSAHMKLPANEEFVLEYVNNKPWSGYNWYQGNAKSLIQINTDLPIFIDRAIDLGAHEGYPGHHVYNALLEESLVRGRGWPEYSVYPLFSPQSLIAEGSANYGIEVAFPAQERVAFERDVLYPLAGLDPARADEYARVNELVSRLGYAGNEAARKYLNGEIDADSAAKWLNTYALMDVARAKQRVKFIETYRSYVINYNYGKDLVRDYVEARAQGDPAARWREFTALLSSPRLPSGLK
jgi:hypothetical protein